MQRMFPQALLACINEGRKPDPLELACVTEKVWREAFMVQRGCGGRERAAALALAAMTGQVGL
jgi:hypothetical protein